MMTVVDGWMSRVVVDEEKVVGDSEVHSRNISPTELWLLAAGLGLE